MIPQSSLSLPGLSASLSAWVGFYAQLGWKLFPCRGKFPLFPSAHPEGDPLRGTCHGACGQVGHGLYDATDDPFTLAIWWRQHPDANIGWALGEAYWALDIDPRSGGDATWFDLQQRYGDIGHVLLSHTGGGGSHYPFLTPPEGVTNKAMVGPGLDVQGNGSYIILPPSVHPDTGKRYLWDIVDGLDTYLPQRAAAWLEHLVSSATGRGPLQQHRAPGSPILLHTRDVTLSRMAIAMARAGLVDSAIRAAIAVENAHCVPPMTSAELDRLCHGKAAAYPPHPVMLLPTPLQGPSSTGNENGYVWGTRPPRLVVTDLADMLEKTYPRPQWLIDGLISEGLVFIVGSPKSSKTYLVHSLALSLAFSVPYKGQWLGHYDVKHPGPVVYITLEDDEADSYFRIKELAPKLQKISRKRLLFIHDFTLPRLNEGLVDALREQILQEYKPALLVIDPISYLYAPTKQGANQFAEVREMLLPLRWLGREQHCAIVGVDHRRKKSADDVDIFETTYGSNAKLAIADAILMLVRDDKEITIHARVRKAQDCTLTLGFEFAADGSAQWTFKGEMNAILNTSQYGDLRQRTIEALSGAAGRPLSIDDLVSGLQLPESRHIRNNLKQVLWRMMKAGEADKTGRGHYIWLGGN